MRFRISAVVLLVLFTLTMLAVLLPGLSAGAVNGLSDDARYAVDRRGIVAPAALSAAAAPERTDGPFQEFLAHNPGWIARWDLIRGLPERLQGPPARIPGYPVCDEGNAEAAARAYLQSQPSSWIPLTELVLARLIPDATGIWVHFRQEHLGIPVWAARVSLRLTRQGEVALLTNRAYPGLPELPAARLAQGVALEEARSGLPGSPAAAGEPQLIYLPLSRAAGVETRLVWKYEFRTEDPPGDWLAFVDTQGGGLLWRFNNIADAATVGLSGRVSALIEPLTADNNFQSVPLPYLEVTLSDPTTQRDTTATDGSYSFVPEGFTSRTLSIPLHGSRGTVMNAASGNSVPGVVANVPDGNPVTFDFVVDSAVAPTNARDAYSSTMVAHDFIQTIESTFHALDYDVPVKINVAGACNAYWDGYGLNFYAAGHGCVDFARIADVVYHEYGHGITTYVYSPFSTSAAMSEAFSDYYAVAITNQPLIGIGATGPGTYLRRLDEDRVFPQDWHDESHNDGLILGSALWDMRQALGAAHADSLWHFARYGYADNFDDYFFDLLIRDDNNGNVYDGTPHLATLAEIFSAHGIGDYAIHVSHAPVPDTEDTLATIPVTAAFLSIYAIDPASVHLHAAIGAGKATRDLDTLMTPTGGVREYRVFLPPQHAGTAISYYLTASDITGRGVTYPPGGVEGQRFFFRVGRDTTPPWIVHTPLPDQPVTIDQLKVIARAGDNLDRPLSSFQLSWRRNGEIETTLAMTPSVRFGYLTEIAPSGFAAGDQIDYKLEAVDGAVEANHALDPASGWHTFHMVGGFLDDFEAHNGGLTGDNDWRYGLAGSRMGAYSGQYVWGTMLTGAYNNATISTLSLPQLDLGSTDRATLVFQYAMRSEFYYDGGHVEISIDRGNTWTVIPPDGDYPLPVVAASGTPGYSGIDGQWREARFDLYHYAQQADVRIRLIFAADEGVVDLGWYVDDLGVVYRQNPDIPLLLTASSGDAGLVRLHWSPPAGLEDEGDTPVRGYNLYRATTPDAEPVLVNPAPLASRDYGDRDVINGTHYVYYVTAVYDGGVESPKVGPAFGWPYAPVISLNPPTVEAVVDSAGTASPSVNVSNAGSGMLNVSVYPAQIGQAIGDVRILLDTGTLPMSAARAGAWKAPAKPAVPAPAVPVPAVPRRHRSRSEGLAELRDALLLTAREKPLSPGLYKGANLALPWDTLATDENDPSEASPDLAMLEVQQDENTLTFRLTAHEPWGNPASAFNLIIGLNTDMNLETGIFGGADFMIVAGAVLHGGAALLDYNGNYVSSLSPLSLATGGTVALFGLPKAALGYPSQLTVQVIALNPTMSAYIDEMPNFFDLSWVEVTSPHLSVSPGSPQLLTMNLGALDLPLGTYHAQLFLESNDRLSPVVALPLTLTVTEETPVLLSGFAGESTDDGVALHWRLTAAVGTPSCRLYRRQAADPPEEETLITEDGLLPAPTGEYAFLDTGAEPATEYEYRLVLVLINGGEESLSRLSVSTKERARPGALWLGQVMPNPATGSVNLRYGLPRRAGVQLHILGPDGRRVRTLFSRSQQRSGYDTAVWDGRDEKGRPVAAGLYFVCLRSGREERTEKLIRIR